MNTTNIAAPQIRDTDAEMAAVIDMMMKNDLVLGNYRIRTRVEDGVVSLQGTVRSDDQRRAAMDKIREIVGIKGIRNYISICPGKA